MFSGTQLLRGTYTSQFVRFSKMQGCSMREFTTFQALTQIAVDFLDGVPIFDLQFRSLQDCGVTVKKLILFGNLALFGLETRWYCSFSAGKYEISRTIAQSYDHMCCFNLAFVSPVAYQRSVVGVSDLPLKMEYLFHFLKVGPAFFRSLSTSLRNFCGPVGWGGVAYVGARKEIYVFIYI